MGTRLLQKPQTGKLASLSAALGFGAVASGGCCTIPLALATVGVSGGWIGGLAAIAPYKPYLLGAAGLTLATGWLFAFRKRVSCEESGACRSVKTSRGSVVLLSIATFAFAAAAFWSWIEPQVNGWLLALQVRS